MSVIPNELPGRRIWDISPLFRGLPPVVRRELRPIRHWCGCSVLWFKELHIFDRPVIAGIPRQYRVDLIVKCHCCACVESFGIHITEEEYNSIVRVLTGRLLTWQEVYARYGRHVNVNDPFYE